MACDAMFQLSGNKREEGCWVEARQPTVNRWLLYSSERELAMNIGGSAVKRFWGGGAGCCCRRRAEQTAVFNFFLRFGASPSLLKFSSKIGWAKRPPPENVEKVSVEYFKFSSIVSV